MKWDHLFPTLEDVVGMGNDSRHLLLLHQQGLCQLPVDVIKDKPFSPKVVNPGAQHLTIDMLLWLRFMSTRSVCSTMCIQTHTCLGMCCM